MYLFQTFATIPLFLKKYYYYWCLCTCIIIIREMYCTVCSNTCMWKPKNNFVQFVFFHLNVSSRVWNMHCISNTIILRDILPALLQLSFMRCTHLCLPFLKELHLFGCYENIGLWKLFSNVPFGLIFWKK